MKKETDSKNNGFELDDFWGFADSDLQNKKNNNDDADWSFDDLFAAKEEKEAALLAEQKTAQERAAAREATRRQIEAEFAAKKKADEEAAAKLREEALRKAEAEAAAQAAARLKAEEEARRLAEEEAAKEEAKRLAEAAEEKERVRRQAEEKAKMSQTRRKPVRMENVEEAPGAEEFSDTATMSLNRLKPEIRLTSVEPPISEGVGPRTSEYDTKELEYEDEYEYDNGEYDDEYEYEDGEYDDEYEYEDGEYDEEYEYEDGEYDDEYEYEDEEYDDYDYEAEEEQPVAGFVPLSNGAAQTAAAGSPKQEYGTEEDWKALEDDDDEEEKSKKPLIIGIVCGIIVLLLVFVIVWAFNRGGRKTPVDASSSVVLQQKMVTGVVTGFDAANQRILVYDAKSGKEVSLDVKEIAALPDVTVGDVVDVEYEDGGTNPVSKLEKSQATIKLNDVKNAVPNGSIIDISGHTYYIDDKLVCLYQGQAFDVKMISKNTTYNVVALDDHIYTIIVTYATGTLKIENLNEYVNSTIVLVPATGDRIEMLITGDMQPIDIQEGSVEIQIKNDKETLYTGKTFISAGKENSLKLPSVKDQKGKVLFNSNIDEEMTIMVNGQEYSGSDEVELAYGEYNGIFTAPGYEDVEMEFKISQPYQQVNVTFEENTTLVTISTSLWGVSLYVDGVYQGELEGNSIGVRLAPGAHAVTCTRTGYYDQHQSIMILEGMDDQMLYFSGFVAIEEESDSTVPESSTPVEESDSSIGNSSENVEDSDTTGDDSEPVTEESGETSTDDTSTEPGDEESAAE